MYVSISKLPAGRLATIFYRASQKHLLSGASKVGDITTLRKIGFLLMSFRRCMGNSKMCIHQARKCVKRSKWWRVSCSLMACPTKKSAATSKISFASYLPRDKDIAGAIIGVPRVV